MDRDKTTPPEIKTSTEFKKIIEGLTNDQVEVGQVFELSRKPNKAELQLITTIGEKEAAISHLQNQNRWFIIKGEQDYVVLNQKLEKTADLLAHYHPPQTICADLPHFDDIFYATASTKREFILHANGITYYKGAKTDPNSGESWKPQQKGDVESKFFAFLETQGKIIDFVQYTKNFRAFLEKIDAAPITKKWEELPDENVFEQFKD